MALRQFAVATFLVAVVPLFMIRGMDGQPGTSGIRAGTLPASWRPSGPDCSGIPEFQTHEYNDDFVILRQSGCTNYEKPFLFLLFGRDKALLVDTGAGQADVARAVRASVDAWLARNHRSAIALVVAHTHAHGDHIAGDDQLRLLPSTTVVAPKLADVTAFFGIRNWPDEIVQFDLGARLLDVIPIPGHEATSLAFYDRQTGVLLTGDSVYPGRLYVADAVQFVQSTHRLVEFTAHVPVAHVLGNHIENTRTPFVDYPVRTVYQPDEHQFELGRAHLLELDEALRRMNGEVTRLALPDFTIWPVRR
jgi:glyoxylase-like metal-dependent hydrolase (beta-lactamase superfamily II)